MTGGSSGAIPGTLNPIFKRFPTCEYVVASLDTAYTEKTENDFSALTIWGVFTDRYRCVAPGCAAHDPQQLRPAQDHPDERMEEAPAAPWAGCRARGLKLTPST